MTDEHRFQDEKFTIESFYDEVWVVCPACGGKAVATADRKRKMAKLVCATCGCNKQESTQGSDWYDIVIAAHRYFNAGLWLQAPFKGDIFWAYNEAHLKYLERYIAAHLRESADRDSFTMVEKLPRFIQAAKNRETLLKLIAKLRAKV